jgi:hypothetical protein
MYVEDFRVSGPENLDAPIWRYIDFAKFVDMLERRALHFSQLGALGDPFEGMPSEGTLEFLRYMDERFRELAIACGVVNAHDWPRRPVRQVYQDFRLSTYVNCWHTNDFESMAMWQLYSRDGIAIRSNFRRLTESVRDVPEQITAGRVIYWDHRDPTAVEFPDDVIEVVFRKGMSYEHEREVRAMIFFDARPPGQTAFSYEESEPTQPKGLTIPVNLDVLIDKVYVAPGRPLWVRELVERVMNTYRPDKPLENSALDYRPDLT